MLNGLSDSIFLGERAALALNYMPTMLSKTILTGLCFLAFFSSSLQAQLHNQGALISIKSGAMLSIQGNLQNAGAIHNSDTIHLYGDFIQNHPTNQGFTSTNEGWLFLDGGQQAIRGNFPSRFHYLVLAGTDHKTAKAQSSFVTGQLRLNEWELALDSQRLEIISTAPNALQTGQSGQYGFISSSGPGGLVRAMDRPAPYLFALGGEDNGLRLFRPILIQPQINDSSQVWASYWAGDAGQYGLDRQQKELELCLLNPLYSHAINREAGSSPLQFSFYSDPNTEGQFEQLAQWNNNWSYLEELQNQFPSFAGLQSLTLDSLLTNWSDSLFILAQKSPELMLEAEAAPYCDNKGILLSETLGQYNDYELYINGQAWGNSSSSSFSPLLAPGQYQLQLLGQNAACGRWSDSLFIEVFPAPQLQLNNDTLIVEGSSLPLQASGADFYNWSPSPNIDCDICSQTIAQPNNSGYIQLLGESMEGCSSLDSFYVELRQKVEDILFIPNVITPNNDGQNDFWVIQNIQLFPKNKLRILNRWGDLVYRADFYNNNWQGDFANGPLPAGTYYYILDLGEGWGVFKGPITIIRQ
ncbi:gliding motility-associated C-terminal domain-containing protein [Saprospira sp. CCB-QB6]|uniref:gliding motility-associated C-terminal domain-containing protein n=1 Tax=Saprospira sp. CCB-QB6 TaxID=3023936 RepID=UPI002349E404|nr:gliding motility-associated C-terminal domain-containing protein [Saprospira sp. CCB-QB6]WCL80010.1 gliding motility-associated C-terminal domain-containing protein [Saprospira sp. CCB-QB6]